MGLSEVLIALATLLPAATSFVLPFDPAAVDEQGRKLYVSDVAIRARFLRSGTPGLVLAPASIPYSFRPVAISICCPKSRV